MSAEKENETRMAWQLEETQMKTKDENELISALLTEREWDHVLLGLEAICEDLSLAIGNHERRGLPCLGLSRALDRYIGVAEKLSRQMGWVEFIL